MTRKMMGVVTLLVLALPLVWMGSRMAPRHAPRMDALPLQVLWAWERPEDLRFANPEHTAVAFLAQTVLIRAGGIELRPRLQPLRVAPGTKLIAVTRLETAAGAAARLDRETRTQIAQAIADSARMPGVLAIQVDYDARLSERDFYRALLVDLRAALPPATPLSITALASWCLGDSWLAGLPVDEAVPMLFQMGPDATTVRLHLKNGRDFSAPLCRGSLGLATNEPLPHVPPARRKYLWSPQAWRADAAPFVSDGAAQ